MSDRAWPAAERDRFLSHLKTPWVLKGLRMIDLWEFLPKPIPRQFGNRLVIWSVRDPQSMYESFNAAGWTGAPLERRLERAKAIYEAYDGPKLIIKHERLTVAMKLFDPRRAGKLPETKRGKRMLVLKLGDGWEPLCRYLRAPVPDRPILGE